MSDTKTLEQWLVEADGAAADGNFDRANKIRQSLNRLIDQGSLERDYLPLYNTREGADTKTRLAVGSSKGPEARLESLQQFQPGAYPVGDNFAWASPPNYPGAPDTLSLYNKPGFDSGDLAEHARILPQALGTVIGAVPGAIGGIPGMMAGGAAGGNAASYLWDKGMDLFGGRVDTRGSGEQAIDMGIESVENALGVNPASKFVGVRSPSGSVDMIDRAASGQASRDMNLDRASKDMGIDFLTAGQRGSPMGSKLESAVESTFAGTGPINRQKDTVLDRSINYIEEQFPQMFSREEAGGILARGAEDTVGYKDRATGLFPEGSLKRTGSDLYNRLDSLIDPEGRINLERSKELLAEHDLRMMNDAEYANLVNTDPDMKRYLRTLKSALEERAPDVVETVGETRIGSSGFPVSPVVRETVEGTGKEASYPLYDTIKQFRTNVGSKIDDPFVTATGGIQGEKRKLYGALSDDLAQGAEDIGGAEARQARSRADWFNRGLMERLEKIDPVFKNADEPTKLYEKLSGMVISSPSTLLAVKKTMPEEAWDAFRDTYFRRLLRAKPGANDETGELFSPATAASGINKLRMSSPEGFEILAGDKAQAIENIQTIGNRLRTNDRFLNRSNTGNSVALTGGLTGIGGLASSGLTGDVGTGLLAAAGVGTATTIVPWLMSKAMTSPKFAKALESLEPAVLSGVDTVRDLQRALIAAGADEAEVAELLEQQ